MEAQRTIERSMVFLKDCVVGIASSGSLSQIRFEICGELSDWWGSGEPYIV
jgi:hypothetical protein